MARRQDNRQARYWIGTVNPEHGGMKVGVELNTTYRAYARFGKDWVQIPEFARAAL